MRVGFSTPDIATAAAWQDIGVPWRVESSLYQVPGEPLCQLHSFFASETFDGRKYQKDDAVHFGRVRWQQCR